jgi:hypothetical protein
MGQFEVQVDEEKLKGREFRLITGDFIKPKETSVRHDAEKLSKKLMEIIIDETLAPDKKRILEYFALSSILKQRRHDKAGKEEKL